MRGVRAVVVVLAVVAGCDGPDEWTCELEVNGATVCLDQNGKDPCESEWGGTASPSELEPGGPYAYCEDLGYEVACAGSLVQEGENFTAQHAYRAASEGDCAAADGALLGG